ncbi:MAG TPA: protein kinase, partial [Candidatus Xenobia bacterium]
MEPGTSFPGTIPVGAVVDGRYRILAPVKAGGMGAVYRAEDLRLSDTTVAVKQMLDASDPDMQAIFERRFHEEMNILTQLRHPGIPRVLDFFRHDQSWCIVMDFIQGSNLEAPGFLPMSPARALEVARQVLQILVYLHGQTPPVMHRDIKPANLIQLAQGGRILLV